MVTVTRYSTMEDTHEPRDQPEPHLDRPDRAAAQETGGLGSAQRTLAAAFYTASSVSPMTAAILWWANRASFAATEDSTRRTVVLAGLAIASIGGVWFGITAPVAATAYLFGRKATSAGRTRLGAATTTIAVVVLVATIVLTVLGDPDPRGPEQRPGLSRRGDPGSR